MLLNMDFRFEVQVWRCMCNITWISNVMLYLIFDPIQFYPIRFHCVLFKSDFRNLLPFDSIQNDSIQIDPIRLKSVELNVDYGGNDEGEDDGDDGQQGARQDVTERCGGGNLYREGLLDVMIMITMGARHSHRVNVPANGIGVDYI